MHLSSKSLGHRFTKFVSKTRSWWKIFGKSKLKKRKWLDDSIWNHIYFLFFLPFKRIANSLRLPSQVKGSTWWVSPAQATHNIVLFLTKPFWKVLLWNTFQTFFFIFKGFSRKFCKAFNADWFFPCKFKRCFPVFSKDGHRCNIHPCKSP